MSLDHVCAEALFEACSIARDDFLLVEANAVLVKVEVNRLYGAARRDTCAVDALVPLHAVLAGSTLRVWDAVATVAALPTWAMVVVLALPTASTSVRSAAFPTTAIGAVEVTLAAPDLTPAGIGFTHHARVHNIALAVFAAVATDAVDTYLAVGGAVVVVIAGGVLGTARTKSEQPER